MAFGFGIIGCGMISNFHAKAVGDLRDAKVVACYDQFPASAQRFAAANNCRAYESLKDMLADDKVDVVTICTPSGAHMEPALAAAKAGKHVIVEKPLEVTLARCDKVIHECEKNGVTLSTIFPSRFHESSQLIKKAVRRLFVEWESFTLILSRAVLSGNSEFRLQLVSRRWRTERLSEQRKRSTN